MTLPQEVPGAIEPDAQGAVGIELRCGPRLHATVIDDHTIEVKCNSRWCGAVDGIVVLHRFDLRTGAVETSKYKAPPKPARS